MHGRRYGGVPLANMSSDADFIGARNILIKTLDAGGPGSRKRPRIDQMFRTGRHHPTRAVNGGT